MNEQTIKGEILGALKDLRDNGPQGLLYGICGEVVLRLQAVPVGSRKHDAVLLSSFEGWPEHSGDVDFPVPAPVALLGPARAFHNCPRWTGPYGDSRRRLLAYAIAKLEAELQEQGATHV